MSSSLKNLKPLMVLVSTLFAGCATTYFIGDSKELGGTEAESVFAKLVAASSAGMFDKPIVLLRAPQPVTPPADTTAGVIGHVVVQITFSELGVVEAVTVVSSTKRSLAEAVLRAVWQWQIEPVTRDGKPQKFTSQAPFQFASGR